MSRNPLKEKINRLKCGAPPRLLDLFAGCGGLSLGFHTAGFKIVAAVESDPHAARSHAENFHSTAPAKEFEAHARPRDITCTQPVQLWRDLCLEGKIDNSIDVIVGGPPCQAFARVGRAKLREVAAHPKAFRLDPRANLYLRYLHYVRRFRPLVLLVENVPDALNYGGNNIPEAMCEALSGMGYVCAYSLLNAVYYGVPQMRERMFLLAYAQELQQIPRFPSPTHWIDLPKGYAGTRQVALKSLAPILFNSHEISYYVAPPTVSPNLHPAITAREALGDLSPITLHLEGRLKRGARRFEHEIPYPDGVEVSAYARLMRNWPGFENVDGVSDHVIRFLPRDYDLFRRMHPGDQYPEAYRHAMELFEEEVARLAKNGNRLVPRTGEYEKLKRRMVPPYDSAKFPNKWRKMEADRPARTLMAHLGKDGYSHIHYDHEQARTISVREAARLQSFPDGFHFAGTMNPAFRQIGNAVPPILANAIARVILRALGIRKGSRPLLNALEQRN